MMKLSNQLFVKKSFVFLALVSFLSAPAESAFWSAPTSQKDYCGFVEDAAAKALCDKTYIEYSAYNKLKKDHLAMCTEMFKFIKEIIPRNWEHPAMCLDLMANRTKANLPEEQSDMCTQLLKSSKSSANFLYCMQEFDPALLKVCRFPQKAGSYSATRDCLARIVGYTSAQIIPQRVEAECFKPVDKQPMLTRSWATFGPCIESMAEAYVEKRKPSRVDDAGKVEVGR